MSDSDHDLYGNLIHPPEGKISAYANGECTPAEQEEIEGHFARCEECRAQLTILLHLCAADETDEDPPWRGSHLPETMIAAYANGECDAAEQEEVEEHLFACDDCSAQLAIQLRMRAEEETEEERRQMEDLFPLGFQALARAREQAGGPEAEPAPAAESRLDSYRQDPAPPGERTPRLPANRPLLMVYGLAATVILVLLGAITYWAPWRSSPIQDGLAALRRSYARSRPIEARVTGGFTYQPYEPTRGDGEPARIDRDQLSYALAELTRAVASHPTAEARHALGRLYLLLGKFPEAEEQIKLALDLDEAALNARLNADLAAIYFEQSKYQEPAPLLSKAVFHDTTALKLDPKLAEAYFNRALCYEHMALFTEARADWEHYLALDSSSAWADEARAHLGKLRARAEGSDNHAGRLQDQFLAAEAAGDEAGMRLLVATHYPAVASLATERVLDEYLAAEGAGDAAGAAARLGTLERIGRLAAEIKGDRFISDAADFASRGSPSVKRGLARVRSVLRQADDEILRSNHEQAFGLYQEARRSAESLGDVCHAEISAFSLARYYHLRPGPRARSSILALILDTERRRHRRLQAQTRLVLANAYASDLEISRALAESLRAVELAKEMGDAQTVINGLRFVAMAYERIGDYSRAVAKNFEAVSFLRRHPSAPIPTALAYGLTGDAFYRVGDYPAALEYQLEGLRVIGPMANPMITAGMVGHLGLTYWKLERYDEAARHLNDAAARARQIQDRAARVMIEADIYTALGDFALERRRPEEAIAAYRQSAGASGEARSRVHLSGIHRGLAAAFQMQGHMAEAEAELRRSVELSERELQRIDEAQGRSLFLASRRNVYHEMADFQFSVRHQPSQAFNYAEVSKSRELLDALSARKELRRSDDRWQLRLSGSAPALRVEQVQRALPPGAQLVEYLVTERGVMLWLVTRDQVVPARAEVEAGQLRRMVATYLDHLRARRGDEGLRREAAELYRALIGPVADRLAPGGVLCVVPDGVLHELPFAALVAPETGRYLVEDYALVTCPSASVLARTLELTRAKRRRDPETFLGLGNPQFSREAFPALPPLPATEREVQSVQGLYLRSSQLSRERATESALARGIGDFDVVHLATHTVIDELSPLLSAIVLAPEGDPAPPGEGAAGDGKLQAFEVYRMRLPRTRLVVLSGCRSALGSAARGEALGGLAQAFFAAGVPTVVASLWDVDDAHTAALMRAFHNAHRSEDQAFGPALRRAQLALLGSADTRQRHPYYWAAFQVAGDGLLNGGPISGGQDP